MTRRGFLLSSFGTVGISAASLLAALPQAGSGADPNDITGKWHFVYSTEGGPRENDADFRLAGDQVTGKYAGADVKGTFKDGDLDLEFPFNSEEAGMTATLKMKGKLKEGKLAGTWTFAEYDGTFTAARPNHL